MDGMEISGRGVYRKRMISEKLKIFRLGNEKILFHIKFCGQIIIMNRTVGLEINIQAHKSILI